MWIVSWLLLTMRIALPMIAEPVRALGVAVSAYHVALFDLFGDLR
jgi:hypothetical protein